MAEKDKNPFDVFRDWFDMAKQCGLYLPEAMTLATSTPDGVPSARMVLLKGVDGDGFTFYTNYGSKKSGELDSNPNAALVLHWNILQRQIRISGRASRTSRQESVAYFNTRPRGSRIAAWASRQSQVLVNRNDLERAFTTKRIEYGQGEIPLPDFWGGYWLRPDSIEFWQGRANRMHDRLFFRRTGSHWASEWLYP